MLLITGQPLNLGELNVLQSESFTPHALPTHYGHSPGVILWAIQFTSCGFCSLILSVEESTAQKQSSPGEVALINCHSQPSCTMPSV